MTNENIPSGDSFEGSTSSTEDLQSSKAHAQSAAHDLRNAAQAKVEEIKQSAGAYCDEARQRAEGAYEEVCSRARTFRDDGEAYVRERPLQTLAVALGAGFVLGLLYRR